MPCGECGRFVSFLGWNLGIVSVQVILTTGHRNEIGERFIKEERFIIFDEDRQSTNLVIVLRLGVSCDTYLYIVREDVNRGGSARRLCLGAPFWPDFAACDLLFARL